MMIRKTPILDQYNETATMKIIIFASILVTLIVATHALVCSDGFCNRVKCNTEELQNCTKSGGYIDVKGGYCGCCDICVHKIEQNGECFPNYLLGVIQKYRCPQDQYCDPVTRRCKNAVNHSKLSKCQRLRLINNIIMPPRSEISCDEDGTLAVQCRSISTDCYCTTKDGEPMFEYRAKTRKQMTCDCARLKKSSLQNIKCDKFGNYIQEAVQ